MPKGGTLSLHDEEGEESEIIVAFPVVNPESIERKIKMTVQQDLVFVIEQDGDLAASCERVLRSVGFDVEIFLDGKPAYERLAVEPAPRLVLVDLQLPNVSGHEITWETWFNLDGSRVVIIAPDQKTAAIYQNKDGVDYVLIKPFSLDELTRIVRPYIYSGYKG